MHALSTPDGPDGLVLARRVLERLGLPAGPEVRLERRRVHRRPDSDTTASFGASGGGSEQVVLLTDADVRGPEIVELGTCRGWVHPHDPQVPGLAHILDPGTVQGWLALETGAAPVEVELLSYRPLRRAVVRVTAAGRSFYAKVWRPERAAEMIGRHRLVDAAGVGPRLVAQPEPGVLVVADAEGASLASRLAHWNATDAALPSPLDLIGLLDRLPTGLLRLSPRPAWSDRPDFHGAAAAATLPGEASEIARIVARLTGLLRSRLDADPVPTHGDFYEANVFVAQGGGLSVIDIDTAGPGRRVDDLACLLGHLAVLPALSPAHYRRVGAVTAEWAAAFARHVDAVELRARTAGVILSLVGGASVEQARHRLELCARWLHTVDAVGPERADR